jgi:hypothetical protein
MPDENKSRRRAMDPWIVLGIFLLGAGAGSLASAALDAKQIRKLIDLLEATAHKNSQTEEQGHKSDGRKSA